MRQLAYVGEDGQIRVRDVDLGTEIEISAPTARGEDVACAWPTWSPDGSQLAYFRYRLAGGQVRQAAICVGTADGSRTVTVQQLGSAGPIYMCWSPDGRRLAVLVQEANELYLRVLDARDDRPGVTVAQGAPLYFVWQPDGRGLVATVGTGRAGAAGRVVWIRLEGGAATQAAVAMRPADGFRAPAWSARLGGATLALARGEGAQLAIQRGPETAPVDLVATGSAPAFLWSPSGDILAFAARPTSEMGLYRGIFAYRAATQTTDALTEEPVLAFFWAPDGRRLVYAAGEADSRMVRLRQLDVATRVEADLGWVRPSRDILLLLSHFDQYAQSAELFAADGGALLLAASRAKENENGTVPVVRQILLFSLDGRESVLGRGRFACWRPGP